MDEVTKITFFKSFADALDEIEDAEEYRACMQALLKYAFSGEEAASTPTAKMFMKLVKPVVDKSKRLSEAGKRGGSHAEAGDKPDASHTQATAKPSGSHSEATAKPSGSHCEQEKEKEKDIGEGDRNKDTGEGNRGSGEEPKGRKRQRFTPPCEEEVAAYCKENGYNISPSEFIDFYQSKGWKVGREPMKDWKAAVRTWVSRRKAQNAPPKNHSDELDDWMLNMINGGNTDGQTGDSENYFFDQGHVSAAF